MSNNRSNAIFDFEFKNKKVIVITNENDGGNIHATIERIDKLPNFNMVIFKDINNRFFSCGGMIVEDTENNRKLIEYAKALYPDQKQMFNFLCEFQSFGRNLSYAEKIYVA